MSLQPVPSIYGGLWFAGQLVAFGGAYAALTRLPANPSAQIPALIYAGGSAAAAVISWGLFKTMSNSPSFRWDKDNVLAHHGPFQPQKPRLYRYLILSVLSLGCFLLAGSIFLAADTPLNVRWVFVIALTLAAAIVFVRMYRFEHDAHARYLVTVAAMDAAQAELRRGLLEGSPGPSEEELEAARKAAEEAARKAAAEEAKRKAEVDRQTAERHRKEAEAARVLREQEHAFLMFRTTYLVQRDFDGTADPQVLRRELKAKLTMGLIAGATWNVLKHSKNPDVAGVVSAPDYAIPRSDAERL